MRNFLDPNGGWTNVFGRKLFITNGEVNSEKYSQLSQLVEVVDTAKIEETFSFRYVITSLINRKLVVTNETGSAHFFYCIRDPINAYIELFNKSAWKVKMNIGQKLNDATLLTTTQTSSLMTSAEECMKKNQIKLVSNVARLRPDLYIKDSYHRFILKGCFCISK